MCKRILVVDDDLAILEVIKIILDEKGYEVATATDSVSLYDEIKDKKPDLILLDIWMSGQDGQEITKFLKANGDTCNIPIVMISANNEGLKMAKDSGADDFLAKPFDIEDLLSKVDKYTAVVA